MDGPLWSRPPRGWMLGGRDSAFYPLGASSTPVTGVWCRSRTEAVVFCRS